MAYLPVLPRLLASLRGGEQIAHPTLIAESLTSGTRMIFQMQHTFLIAAKGAIFITSDAPCSIFNAALQGTFYAPGGLAHPQVELFLPLSPQIGFMGTYRMDEGYRPVPRDIVNELVRRTRAYSDRVIISCTDRTDPYWFRDTP